jgi:glycine/D-amino acid oxidase-like deaminating enzyme
LARVPPFAIADGSIMDDSRIFAPDFKLQPFWLDGRGPIPPSSDDPFPNRVDVVVVGAGVTGVEAGRALAERGRDVLVLDAGEPGEGASSRNAGQIGRNFKHAYSQLKANFGMATAQGFFDELQQAYDSVKRAGENDPDAFEWRECGRVIGAMTTSHLERLHREYSLRASDIGEAVELLGRADAQAELRSELYAGAIRLLRNGSVQPSRYHRFLWNGALRAGARVVGHTPVSGIRREADGFAVTTSRGVVRCKQVLIATNGYSGSAMPWIQRRLLPINAYVVMTEALTADKIAAALPGLRTYHDNRRRSHFFTVSASGNRILMGGRTGSFVRNLRAMAAELHGDLQFILPSLEDVRLSHAWTGRCAAPFDLFPRFGEKDGMFYALGYSFSGMAMGPHLARKVAALMVGDLEGAHSLFARPTFPRVPFVARGPWTEPVVTGWWGWADRPKGIARGI